MRLLQRLWVERPDLEVRWLAEIDQEEVVYRAHALLESMASDSVAGPAPGDDLGADTRAGVEEAL
jgi:hypothetical protein